MMDRYSTHSGPSGEPDPEAYEALISPHLPSLRRWVRSKAPRGVDEEDVVQQTLVLALRNIAGIRLEASVGTWLCAIALNVIRGRLRSPDHSRVVYYGLLQVEPLYGKDPGPSPLDALEQQEAYAFLHQVISMLPERYRSVVELRDLKEFSTEETMDTLSISRTAVTSRHYRARRMLLKLLNRGPEPPKSRRQSLALALKTAALTGVLAVCGFAQQASVPELTLDQALDQALQNNSSLKKASLEVTSSEADLAANRTKRFASLQLTALGSMLLTKPEITFQRGAFGSFAATGPIPASDQTLSIARKPVGIIYATVSQPLTTLYKIHWQLRALAIQRDSAQQDSVQQRQDIVDQVRGAYYEVAKAQSELESSTKSLPYYQESKRLAAENLKHETILESDLLKADVQLVKTQNLLNDDADRVAQAAEKLNELMGRDIHMQFKVSDPGGIEAVAESMETLERRALQNRPDLKKAELQVRQAEYDIRAKKAEYIPDVSLSVNYVNTTNFGSTLPSNITTAGLQLSWEPWDWGRKRQELAGKRVKEEEAKVAVDSAARSALVQVRSAWRQLESARRTLALSEATQRAARQKLRETQEQVKVEKALTKDLFSAESDLASADSQYRQALASFWSARADLKKATGGE